MDNADPIRPEQFSDSDYDAVSNSITRRRTWKVLRDPVAPATPGTNHEANDSVVKEAMQIAGAAPFHYDRCVDGVPEPWRFYFLSQATCQNIATRVPEWFDDVKPSNKIPAMLSACGSLVLVTWLPQFRGSAQDESAEAFSHEKRAQVDDEHLAASSAAVQNLLLLLTARNLGTYWSSGGLFRMKAMFERIGVAQNESLLAAVFVDYAPSGEASETVQRIPGKLANRRSSSEKWLREIVV